MFKLKLNGQGSKCLTPPKLRHVKIICSRRPTANSAFMRLTVEINIRMILFFNIKTLSKDYFMQTSTFFLSFYYKICLFYPDVSLSLKNLDTRNTGQNVFVLTEIIFG